MGVTLRSPRNQCLGLRATAHVIVTKSESHISFEEIWLYGRYTYGALGTYPLRSGLIELAHQAQGEERTHILEVGANPHIHLIPARVARHVLNQDLRLA